MDHNTRSTHWIRPSPSLPSMTEEWLKLEKERTDEQSKAFAEHAYHELTKTKMTLEALQKERVDEKKWCDEWCLQVMRDGAARRAEAMEAQSRVEEIQNDLVEMEVEMEVTHQAYSLTTKALRAECKKRGLKRYSRLRKIDLVQKYKEAKKKERHADELHRQQLQDALEA